MSDPTTKSHRRFTREEKRWLRSAGLHRPFEPAVSVLYEWSERWAGYPDNSAPPMSDRSTWPWPARMADSLANALDLAGLWIVQRRPHR